jgi:peroxiredoxin
VVGISVDSAEESQRLEARLKLRFPLLSDPKMKVITAYGVADADKEISVPAVFVVDGKRRIHYRHVGESITDRPEVEAVLGGVSQR